MSGENISARVLNAVKPKLWKYICLTIVLVLLSHEPFEALATGATVETESLVFGIIGLATIVCSWVNYCLSRKAYRKYKSTVN
ncbi:hypothetical protein LQZ18_11525 [Lachnospiraceae bacterium ZAX-1]